VWDPAHVYAYRDKKLPAAARVIAAAFRAAMDAAHATPADAIHQDEVAEDRRRLDTHFGGASALPEASTKNAHAASAPGSRP
jgi:hypothetical protein